MKLLYTSPVMQHPAAGGPQLRVENSIKALSKVADLHLLSCDPEAGELRRDSADFFRNYGRSFALAPRLEREPPAGRLVRKLVRAGRRFLDSDAREDAGTVLELVDRHGIEALWCGYGNISFPLMRRVKALRPGLPVVCDTDSVWSRFILRELPFAHGPRRRRIAWDGAAKQREERAWVDLCDVTTAVSEVDAEYYRGIVREPGRIHVFPNVIDVDTYRSPPPKPAGFKNPCIYLAGTFGHFHSPMDSAARWVLEKVLPNLLRTRPELHFYLVGNNSDKGFGHLSGRNFTATGRLESVLPYLCHADVALVPLQFESGTRFKILEAGACRTPLVSTTLGAEGLPVEHGKHLLLADEPESFAQAIASLLDDKEKARVLASNCHQLVCNRFGIPALVRDAERIFNSITRRPANQIQGAQA
jgi:glycosyltransferase involved in cell wall biosynthesis